MVSDVVRARAAWVVFALVAFVVPIAGSALAETGETATSIVLPASGQTDSYPSDLADGGPDAVAVPDDGAVRAGAPLRYRDNGDGTITDLNTRLVWEKKCSGCGGLHDVASRYPWSGDGEAETIWDWLGRLNGRRSVSDTGSVSGEGGVDAAGARADSSAAESLPGAGFAGHTDWRIPNITELVSIVDYGAFHPAVGRAFHGDACDDECTDVSAAGCSCTSLGEYWSSTTFADFPAHAYVLFFGMGLANDRVKTNSLFVRAVRGGE